MWGVHVVRAAWRRQALQIFIYLRGHKVHCLRGGSSALARPGGFPGGQSILIEKSTQLCANLACCPCFSVTVDPNMLRSDVFVDFLKRLQLVRLLFFTKVIFRCRTCPLVNHVCFSSHQHPQTLTSTDISVACQTEHWRLDTGWVCVWGLWWKAPWSGAFLKKMTSKLVLVDFWGWQGDKILL